MMPTLYRGLVQFGVPYRNPSNTHALVNGQILFILLAVISINSHVFMAPSVFPSINKCNLENTFCTRIKIHLIYFSVHFYISRMTTCTRYIYSLHNSDTHQDTYPIFLLLFLFYDTERVWNELRQEYSSFPKIRLDDWVGWSWIITFRIAHSLYPRPRLITTTKKSLSNCQSKLASNWQESRSLKGKYCQWVGQ